MNMFNTDKRINLSQAVIDAIRSFPLERTVEHCGKSFFVSPFDLYATCPVCHVKVKVRSFSAVTELEDVFDAVFAWMAQPGAIEIVRKRQAEMADESAE